MMNPFRIRSMHNPWFEMAGGDFIRCIVVLSALALLKCGEAARSPSADGASREEARPSAECEQAWAQAPARDLVELLANATSTQTPVWSGYGLADGAYVLHAGSSESGNACLGLWRGGRAQGFAALPDEPNLNTLLYGYHLPPEGNERLAEWAQPASIRTWLEKAGVERATLMPTEVDDFPFPLTALVKVQVALHEGFHVEVQSPGWAEGKTSAPVWDLQPDLKALQACYSGSPAVKKELEEERTALVSHVEALLDGDSARACSTGAEFLSRRASRRGLVEDIDVPRHDDTPGTCAEAEAIMELEEGAADYASWTALHELALVTREQLLGRYRADQSEIFYLTGAMQLHAASLMHPEPMSRLSQDIVESATPAEGSIEAVFGGVLASYCEQ